jgi:hypothetical protein
MRNMSLSKEAVAEAATMFRAVKFLFSDMNESKYESAQPFVLYLRACMEELFQMVPIKYGNSEPWAAKMDWRSNTSYYMEFVTDKLNECFDEYEKRNSCDLPFDLYEGFVDVLDQCRSWMSKLIEEEPELEEAGMELGPIRRVTKGEYEGRERVRAEVRGYGPETGSGVEKEREMREMIEEADRDNDGHVTFEDFYRIMKKPSDDDDDVSALAARGGG